MLKNLRILCVDDEATIARTLAKIVKNKGAISREAHDVQEAMTAIGELYPNVIITDLEMPERAGGSVYDIAGLLLATKAKEISTAIKVILYTARSKEEITPDIDFFVDGYIRKPSRKDIILSVVRTAGLAFA